MPLSTTDAVATLLMRPLSTAETAAAQAVIDRLSGLITLRVPDVDTRIAAAPAYAAVVSGAIAAAIARWLRNPSGLVQDSNGQITQRWAEAGTGEVVLSESEWAAIIPEAATAVAGTGMYVVPLGG